jgi:hypothetical protein
MIINTKNPAVVGKPLLGTENHKGGIPLVLPTIAVTGSQVNGGRQTPNEAVMAVGGHSVLLQGIDTLSITAGGNQASDWLVEQSQIWNDYQKSYQAPDDFICIE